jgi:hypothetical protein
MKKNVLASVITLAAILVGNAAGAKTMGDSMQMSSMHGMPPGSEGPAYTGKPDLATTAALTQAGGGAGNFSIQKALIAMVGPELTAKEIKKLTKQYGKAAVTSWINVFDFSIQQAATIATAAGVQFPTPPTDLQGKALAVQLVKDGSPSGTFQTASMLDHLVTHKIHVSTMDAIDAKYGAKADGSYHRITNQAMYDFAQALGESNITLASFH